MDFDVVYKGVKVTRLNPRLVAQKNLSEEEVEHIKRLHVVRLEIEDHMREAPEVDLKALYADWHDNQQYLQEAWKFPKNDNFIRFWEVPRCTCPKMDNEERCGVGHFIVSCNCPVHGD